MKNIIKTTAYSLVAFASVATTNVSAKVNYNTQHAEQLAGADDNGGNIGETITKFMSYILGFLALIGVIFAIYGGFQILTAGGDDEKVKKGKTTLINSLLGIFVIWIAWALISWVVGGLSDVGAGA